MHPTLTWVGLENPLGVSFWGGLSISPYLSFTHHVRKQTSADSAICCSLRRLGLHAHGTNAPGFSHHGPPPDITLHRREQKFVGGAINPGGLREDEQIMVLNPT